MNVIYELPKLDAILESLANQKRRGIVHSLSLQPSTVGKLAREFDLSLPAIHKHIRSLENAEIIIRKKRGRTNFVTLDSRGLGLAQKWIMQYHTEWGNVDATLENYIASMKE